MAREFGGSRFFALGAVWWFVIAGALGVLHWFGLVETPFVVVVAVAVALIGSFVLVWLGKPK